MTKVVLFNGPPRSGKDTAAISALLHVRKEMNYNLDRVRVDKFAMPIKRAFAGMINTPIDEFGNAWEYERQKETKVPVLGVSYRQWQIDFSERYMRDLYGTDVFARLFCDRNKDADVVLVSDCGFSVEGKEITEHFGHDNVMLVRLHRDGCTFKGDSRSYVEFPCYRNVDLQNDGTVWEFQDKVNGLVEAFLRDKS